ncbi:Uncharacterised protein [Kluyvera cryocrescens]|uniref:Uncharacterized protein n=1 Tax=Kluyvera cryocrescens TaxID=580 RepID=A0A485CPZ7_KLUCR|nr:Uncharacterised protein [Kluyvera cryocrescens]
MKKKPGVALRSRAITTLLHDAVVNVLAFFRGRREVLIQPRFADGITLTAQEQTHIHRLG